MRIYWIAAILAVTLAACEGPMGPAGVQGEQGLQGVQGPAGIAGGALVYHFYGQLASEPTLLELDGITAYADQMPVVIVGLTDTEDGPFALYSSTSFGGDNLLGIYFGASTDQDILIGIISTDPSIIGWWYTVTVIVPPA